MKCGEYLSQSIEFGGETIPRGKVYQRLVKTAIDQGHDRKDAGRLADRWMQGHDLRVSVGARRTENGMISTPYGMAELLKFNWAYGVKVRLKSGQITEFAFWEVSWGGKTA